jgi:hypothetical protein
LAATVLERVLRRVETDLDPEEVQDMVDEALVAIEDLYGPPADPGNPITVYRRGGGRIIDPGRPIDVAQAVAITETAAWDWWWGGATSVVLAPTDYRITNRGRTIERLHTGAYPRWSWGRDVTITYTPVNDADARQETTIKLVLLNIQYQGLNSQSAGDVSQSFVNYQQERDRLLGALSPRKLSIL